MKVRLVQNGIFTIIDDVAKAVFPPESGFYWIDAEVEDLVTLQPLFQLHDLAIEDCLNEEEQRPKLEIFDTHYFIVVNSIRFDDEEIFLREMNIFLGKHYVITATRQKLREIRSIKPIMMEEQINSPDKFLYYLLDLVVDNYFTVGYRIESKIEKLDEDILMHPRKSHQNEIIGLRSEIMWLKNVLGPQKNVIMALTKKDLRLVDENLQKYFNDIYENAVKIHETFDTFRDLIGNLREAYQLSLSNRMNDIMRMFTALTTIFMPMTIITSLYGMNFDNMPELHWRYGYYGVLALLVGVGAAMYYLFRKKEWL